MKRSTFTLLAATLLAATAAQAQMIRNSGTVLPMPGSVAPKPPVSPVTPGHRAPGLPLPIPTLAAPVIVLAERLVLVSPIVQAASAELAEGRAVPSETAARRRMPAAVKGVGQSLDQMRSRFALNAEGSAEPAKLAESAFDGSTRPEEKDAVSLPDRESPQRTEAPRRRSGSPQRPHRLPEQDLERDLGMHY